jgi:hypothetical protein
MAEAGPIASGTLRPHRRRHHWRWLTAIVAAASVIVGLGLIAADRLASSYEPEVTILWDVYADQTVGDDRVAVHLIHRLVDSDYSTIVELRWTQDRRKHTTAYDLGYVPDVPAGVAEVVSRSATAFDLVIGAYRYRIELDWAARRVTRWECLQQCATFDPSRPPIKTT